jgi:hypothetical protein
MDPITQQVVLAAAGAAGGDATYVDDVFSTYVYEGTGAAKTITNGIDLSGEGGLVWIKQRDESRNHSLYDTERGVLRQLVSNANFGQGGASGNDLDGFNSDGFSLGTDTFSIVNKSGGEYASWAFRKAPGFFDVVTYTGNGTNRSIAHSLGSVPGCILIKCTSRSGDDWIVYHRSVGNTKFLNLNQDYGASTDAAAWNSSTPTSTVFYLGTKGQVNTSGQSYVAYIFAHDDQSFGTNSDEAIIKCGSYTGNGSETGPVIDLGFEPQWLLIKRTSNTDPWILFDNMRGMATGSQDARLEPSETDAEDLFGGVDLLPTGFQLASSTGFQNSSGETYIYMAIRRPNKPPEAATEVFAVANADGSAPRFNSGFPVDLAIEHYTGGGFSNYPGWGSRLQGQKFMKSSSDAAEATLSNYYWDYMDGWNSTSSANTTLVSHMFKRAPGVFDVVTYTGTGSVTTVNHNLAAVPELIILKGREDIHNWSVYTQTLGRNKVLYLNADEAASTFNAPSFWGSTDFTSTQFSLGTYWNTNRSGYDYVAYLFASLNGISKVGTYSGTGSNIDVDCGFTAGARFVLIKRTDGSNGQHVGDWYVWDTLRGIVSGNDPYLLLNTTDAQVTNTDYIDPLNAGFTVTSSAPAALNTSGGTYMFLAIA